MYKGLDAYSGVMEKVSWQGSEVLEHPYAKITRASSLDPL